MPSQEHNQLKYLARKSCPVFLMVTRILFFVANFNAADTSCAFVAATTYSERRLAAPHALLEDPEHTCSLFPTCVPNSFHAASPGYSGDPGY